MVRGVLVDAGVGDPSSPALADRPPSITKPAEQHAEVVAGERRPAEGPSRLADVEHGEGGQAEDEHEEDG